MATKNKNAAQKVMEQVGVRTAANCAKSQASMNELKSAEQIALELLAKVRSQGMIFANDNFKTKYANDLLRDKAVVFHRDFTRAADELTAIRNNISNIDLKSSPEDCMIACIEHSQSVFAWIENFQQLVIPVIADIHDLINANSDAIEKAHAEWAEEQKQNKA